MPTISLLALNAALAVVVVTLNKGTQWVGRVVSDLGLMLAQLACIRRSIVDHSIMTISIHQSGSLEKEWACYHFSTYEILQLSGQVRPSEASECSSSYIICL
jgi:hypothetical protein